MNKVTFPFRFTRTEHIDGDIFKFYATFSGYVNNDEGYINLDITKITEAYLLRDNEIKIDILDSFNRLPFGESYLDSIISLHCINNNVAEKLVDEKYDELQNRLYEEHINN